MSDAESLQSAARSRSAEQRRASDAESQQAAASNHFGSSAGTGGDGRSKHCEQSQIHAAASTNSCSSTESSISDDINNGKLWMCTMNVRGARKRVGKILKLAANMGLAALCLQEMSLTQGVISTAKQAGKKAGWCWR